MELSASIEQDRVCVIPICQTDSWFCTFHLVNAEMLAQELLGHLGDRWAAAEKKKCTLNIDNRLLKKKMIVDGVLLRYFASPI